MITNDSRGLHRQRPNDQRLRRVGAFRSSPPKIFDFSQPILKGGNPARPMHALGRSPEPVHAAVRARVPRPWTAVGAPAPVRVQDRHAARAGRAARGERVGRAAGRAGGRASGSWCPAAPGGAIGLQDLRVRRRSSVRLLRSWTPPPTTVDLGGVRLFSSLRFQDRGGVQRGSGAEEGSQPGQVRLGVSSW